MPVISELWRKDILVAIIRDNQVINFSEDAPILIKRVYILSITL